MGNISPFAYVEWLAEEMQLAEALSEVKEVQKSKDAALRIDELVSAIAIFKEYLKHCGN